MNLPDDLELPLIGGAGFWYWLGGRPAFDFVNTRRERWWRDVETLVVPGDLSAWLNEAGLLEAPAAVTTRQLQAAHRLRGALDAGILAAIDGQLPSARAIEEINRWLIRAASVQRLVSDHRTVVLRSHPPDNPVEHALHAIAQDAATVLGTDLRARARVCASDTCSARFFDASRAGTRKWCSMSSCGNTAKARRHRSRTKK